MKPSDEWQRWEPRERMAEVPDPWQGFGDQDPEKELRAWDRTHGHKRWEFKVKVSSIVSTVKRIFKGE